MVDLLFAGEVREKLSRAAEMLWNAALMQRDLKFVQSTDSQVEMGISLIREELKGAHSPLSALLIHLLLRELLFQIIDHPDPATLVRSLEERSKTVELALQEQAIPFKAVDEVDLALLGAIKRIGGTNSLFIERVEGSQLEFTIAPGICLEMHLRSSFGSRYFTTDEKNELASLDNPSVLLIDQKVKVAQELLPIVDYVLKRDMPLLIVALDIEGEALSTLVMNKIRGNLQVVPIRVRGDEWQHLSLLTGATVIGPTRGIPLKGAGFSVLGQAERVIVGLEKSVLIAKNAQRDGEEVALVRVGNRVQEERIQALQMAYDKGYLPHLGEAFRLAVSHLYEEDPLRKVFEAADIALIESRMSLVQMGLGQRSGAPSELVLQAVRSAIKMATTIALTDVMLVPNSEKGSA